MFSPAHSFNGDVSKWGVGTVTTMEGMLGLGLGLGLVLGLELV